MKLDIQSARDSQQSQLEEFGADIHMLKQAMQNARDKLAALQEHSERLEREQSIELKQLRMDEAMTRLRLAVLTNPQQSLLLLMTAAQLPVAPPLTKPNPYE